jgi:hypothetical protein
VTRKPKAKRTPLEDAIKVVEGLRSLCDPECEGRCRVCPQDAVDDLIRQARLAATTEGDR